jgi:hypothetical protein
MGAARPWNTDLRGPSYIDFLRRNLLYLCSFLANKNCRIMENGISVNT